MIGSMGWKSTSFTMLRWPGSRYLRLTAPPNHHLMPNDVVSYTYTKPSPLPQLAIDKSGLHEQRSRFPLAPCYASPLVASPTVCPRISFTQRLSPSKKALMSHTRSPASRELLSLVLTALSHAYR